MRRPKKFTELPLQAKEIASQPSDVTERYRELQHLRRRVEELEKLKPSDLAERYREVQRLRRRVEKFYKTDSPGCSKLIEEHRE
jgi:hypothetical protein